VGRFAAALKLYERAKAFYLKAAQADPARKSEIDEIVAKNDALIKEGQAAALLRRVRGLSEDTDYEKAIEEAGKLLSEFADTEVAHQNAELVALLEKEAKDWEQKKSESLAKKVPELYRSRRSTLIAQYAGAKFKVAEARGQVGAIDEAVGAELSRKLKCASDEIAQAWAKREQKTRTVSYGSGSWIVLGGQPGGLDTNEQYQKGKKNNNGNDPVDDIIYRFGGRNRPEPKAVDLGRKLQTEEEWWSSASPTDRRNWLESEYARTSNAVTKTEQAKKCGVCKGEGMLKTVRSGVAVEVKCPRCHGAKDDLSVQYW
jgi:tetratricopeptide (TPR) repeat protein